MWKRLKTWFWRRWYGEMHSGWGCDTCDEQAVRKLSKDNCPYISDWNIMYLCRCCWQSHYDVLKHEFERNARHRKDKPSRGDSGVEG